MNGIVAGLLLWAAAQEPKVETVAIPGTDFKFEMLYVPGGKLGDSELRPYWMSRNEVTWEAFAKFFENRKAAKVDGITRPSAPYEPPHGAMGTGNHPAVGMRWHGAITYCEWLSALTGQRFRLPTDAEWEFAARAGSGGAAPENLEETAWFKGNAGNKTHPGGSKKSNAFGFNDLFGNVWEYVLEQDAPPDFNPVIRGGGWKTEAADFKFAMRDVIHPEWFERDPNRPRSTWWLTDGPFVGFRVVRFADPASKQEQEAYGAKLQVELQLGKQAKALSRVSGTLKNTGDRSLDEVELLVYFLDPDGKPMIEDGKNRASFSKAYPVLVNSGKPGEQRAPLAPGASRAFSLELPQPFEVDTEPDKLGASVRALQFSGK